MNKNSKVSTAAILSCMRARRVSEYGTEKIDYIGQIRGSVKPGLRCLDTKRSNRHSRTSRIQHY
jgi:hypothetical protein